MIIAYLISKIRSSIYETFHISLHIIIIIVIIIFIIIAELSCEELADFVLVQSKFEEITLKNKMDCTYARNPLSDKQAKMACNRDVLRGTNVRPFLSGTDEFIINCVLRDIPHGSGSLKTPFGEPVYSGDWCEGTANLII